MVALDTVTTGGDRRGCGWTAGWSARNTGPRRLAQTSRGAALGVPVVAVTQPAIEVEQRVVVGQPAHLHVGLGVRADDLEPVRTQSCARSEAAGH
jgi:hypothetical protein